MNRNTLIWGVILLTAAVVIGIRTVKTGMGRSYVRRVEVAGKTPEAPKTVRYQPAVPRDRTQPDVQLSVSRTLGLWTAALLTLCAFSFLYGDNPFYKFIEALVVGTSAAYAMVQGFWATIIPDLAAKLAPTFVRSSVQPGLPPDAHFEWIYLVPLVLGIMMLCRLGPRQTAWIARWPLALLIGATAGIRLLAYLQADFIQQVRNSIIPLIVLIADPQGNLSAYESLKASLKNIGIVASLLACLCYFFFSVEHKRVMGRAARLGIWVLMITFGAGFGYTVMGRITLLAARFEFIFDRWLWLIDPRHTH